LLIKIKGRTQENGPVDREFLFLENYYALLGANSDFNEDNNANGQTCPHAEVRRNFL